MGKLNIAHHKSYHPYRRDNIEKVRRDEEEARQKEAVADGRMMLADSEARMDVLRQRAGADSARRNLGSNDEQLESPSGPSSIMLRGHINLFEDLERQAMPVAVGGKKNTPAETDKGVPLAPTAKDLNPWYSDRDHERNKEPDRGKKTRDLARKSLHDPLTSISRQLASRDTSSATNHHRRPTVPRPSSPMMSAPPEIVARLDRELSERQRALELIKRKRREKAGSETPSTIHGGMSGGYGDVFNRREVEEAHRTRDRRWDRDYDRAWHGRGAHIGR